MPAWLACAAFESPLIVPLSRWAAMMDRALQQVLEAAFKSHQAGQLDEAERHYRELLSRDPVNPDALHLLGLLHHQRGQSGEAEDLVAKAIKHRREAVYYENLAAIQKARGAPARAVETCRAGLKHTASPRLAATLLDTLLDIGEYGEALAMLDGLDQHEPTTAARTADRAFCLVRLGRLRDAASAAERALEIEGANGNALAVLAEIASGHGDHGKAAELWRRALSGRPDWIAARVNLGLSLVRLGEAYSALDMLRHVPMPTEPELATKLLNGLAAAYRATRKPDLARRCLESAVVLMPGTAEFLSNLSEVRRPDNAACARRLAERALAVDSAAAGAHSNRALALEELDQLGEAAAGIRRAIALEPADPHFLNNLDGPLRWSGRYHEARAMQYRSLATDASFAPAWYGLGTLQLKMGELEQGWVNYDWRMRSALIQEPRPFRLPLWQGPKQSSGALLVWGEQGLGDEIVYGSMLPDLVRDGIKAVVECDARMVSLFERALPSLAFVARRTPPAEHLDGDGIATQVPMGSLAKWYRTRVEDFPVSGAYLKPRQDLIDHWRARLAELGDGPKIGFAWRSRRIDGLARRFHPPILEWAPILTQPQATFVSLQYGEANDDIQMVEATLGTKLHRFPDLDLMNDLEGVLALSAAVDMTISTATTAFTFPGAAGTPVWLLLPDNDFWMFGTDRYPWFPTVRVYAHPHARPWSEIIGQMGRELEAWLAKRQRAR
jgi:Flp pilus assembly protein TadD